MKKELIIIEKENDELFNKLAALYGTYFDSIAIPEIEHKKVKYMILKAFNTNENSQLAYTGLFKSDPEMYFKPEVRASFIDGLYIALMKKADSIGGDLNEVREAFFRTASSVYKDMFKQLAGVEYDIVIGPDNYKQMAMTIDGHFISHENTKSFIGDILKIDFDDYVKVIEKTIFSGVFDPICGTVKKSVTLYINKKFVNEVIFKLNNYMNSAKTVDYEKELAAAKDEVNKAKEILAESRSESRYYKDLYNNVMQIRDEEKEEMLKSLRTEAAKPTDIQDTSDELLDEDGWTKLR